VQKPPYVSVSTLSQYLALDISLRERKVWYWFTKWYVIPYALRLGEWNKLTVYLDATYPLQHFIRENLSARFSRIQYRLRSMTRWCKNRLSHPRKHLIKGAFTRDYQDLDTIIVNFCLECIIEYVDREKCFECCTWDHTAEHIRKAEMIKKIYEYATTGRNLLRKEIDLLWDRVPFQAVKLDDYDAIDRKEKEMKDLDTKYCNWVVNNRKYLWT
jgi:hypothetical protein